jgi:hypothetical protein
MAPDGHARSSTARLSAARRTLDFGHPQIGEVSPFMHKTGHSGSRSSDRNGSNPSTRQQLCKKPWEEEAIATRAHYLGMFTRVRFRVRHHVPQPFLCVRCPSVSSQDGTKHNQTFTQHHIPSSSCQCPHLLAHTPTCTVFSAPPQAPSSPVAQPAASEPAPSAQRPRCRACRRDMHVELYGSGHHARERWCEPEVKRRRRWGARRRVRACVRACCACMP